MDDDDEPCQIPRDTSAEPFESLRDAIDDGFSVGHADGVLDVDAVLDAGRPQPSTGEETVDDRLALAVLDEKSLLSAPFCADNRGVPARYRADWCREYVRGAKVAHGEVVLRRRRM